MPPATRRPREPRRKGPGAPGRRPAQGCHRPAVQPRAAARPPPTGSAPEKAIAPGEAANSDDAGRTSSGISADMGMYVSEAGKHPAGPGDPESGVHAAPDDKMCRPMREGNEKNDLRGGRRCQREGILFPRVANLRGQWWRGPARRAKGPGAPEALPAHRAGPCRPAPPHPRGGGRQRPRRRLLVSAGPRKPRADRPHGHAAADPRLGPKKLPELA